MQGLGFRGLGLGFPLHDDDIFCVCVCVLCLCLSLSLAQALWWEVMPVVLVPVPKFACFWLCAAEVF